MTGNVTISVSYAWHSIRVPVIVPLLRLAIMLCSVMSIMLFIERLYMAVVILFVKVLGKKRYTKYKLESMKEDLESYPSVLVQIPMYNEKEVRRICFLNLAKFKHLFFVLAHETKILIVMYTKLHCEINHVFLSPLMNFS